MRWRNRELGTWELCRTRWLWVSGTTPRNADVWTLDVMLGRESANPGIWAQTGPHLGFTLWLNETRTMEWHRSRRCPCYQCKMDAMRGRWTPVTTYTYWVEREGRFWVIHVEGVGVTQARRGRMEVKHMARDLVAIVKNVPTRTVKLELIGRPRGGTR